jgi:hypothetical protein
VRYKQSKGRQIDIIDDGLHRVHCRSFACVKVKQGKNRKEQPTRKQQYRTHTCRQNISGCEISDTASLVLVLAAAREVIVVVEYSDDEPELVLMRLLLLLLLGTIIDNDVVAQLLRIVRRTTVTARPLPLCAVALTRARWTAMRENNMILLLYFGGGRFAVWKLVTTQQLDRQAALCVVCCVLSPSPSQIFWLQAVRRIGRVGSEKPKLETRRHSRVRNCACACAVLYSTVQYSTELHLTGLHLTGRMVKILDLLRRLSGFCRHHGSVRITTDI